MKKIICIIISLLSACVFSLADAHPEDNHADKTFCFVYVARSQYTDLESLVEYLDARYERALSSKDFVLVIYMADGSVPHVVEVNTPSDNRNDYAALIKELKSGRSHRIDSAYDIDNLVGLFNRLDFVSPASDDMKYGAVDWHFHVTSDFWNRGYNESLIASLCFVMGVDQFKDENFRLRCYFNRYDDLSIDEEYPFGKKNYCDIDFRPYYY